MTTLIQTLIMLFFVIVTLLGNCIHALPPINFTDTVLTNRMIEALSDVLVSRDGHHLTPFQQLRQQQQQIRQHPYYQQQYPEQQAHAQAQSYTQAQAQAYTQAQAQALAQAQAYTQAQAQAQPQAQAQAQPQPQAQAQAQPQAQPHYASQSSEYQQQHYPNQLPEYQQQQHHPSQLPEHQQQQHHQQQQQQHHQQQQEHYPNQTPINQYSFHQQQFVEQYPQQQQQQPSPQQQPQFQQPTHQPNVPEQKFQQPAQQHHLPEQQQQQIVPAGTDSRGYYYPYPYQNVNWYNFPYLWQGVTGGHLDATAPLAGVGAQLTGLGTGGCPVGLCPNGATCQQESGQWQCGCGLNGCPGIQNPCGLYGQYYFPYYPDASRFIQCDGTGVFWIRKCAPGTIFDPKIGVCNYPPVVVETGKK